MTVTHMHSKGIGWVEENIIYLWDFKWGALSVWEDKKCRVVKWEMVSRKRDFRRQGTHCTLSRLINFLCNRESTVKLLCALDLRKEVPSLLVPLIKPPDSGNNFCFKKWTMLKKSPNTTENVVILPQLLLKNPKTSLIKMKLHCTWHLLNWFKKERQI